MSSPVITVYKATHGLCSSAGRDANPKGNVRDKANCLVRKFFRGGRNIRWHVPRDFFFGGGGKIKFPVGASREYRDPHTQDYKSLYVVVRLS